MQAKMRKREVTELRQCGYSILTMMSGFQKSKLCNPLSEGLAEWRSLRTWHVWRDLKVNMGDLNISTGGCKVSGKG